MKLKEWLRQYHQMSYADYKKLPYTERTIMEGDFQYFNNKLNRTKQIHDRQNWRPMTEEEIERINIITEQEMKRYEISLKIGGIDDCGNYTALLHRWD